MRLRLTPAAVLLLLSAGILSAEPVQTVLTANSVLYTVSSSSDGASLQVTRRIGDVRTTLLVPGTDDAALDNDGQLVWDSCSDDLYVAWHRQADGNDEVRLAVLNAAGEWEQPLVVDARSDRSHLGLQMVLTHARAAEDQPEATLVHAAWWAAGVAFEPEYAIVAFEGGRHLSTAVANLQDLAAVVDGDTSEVEDTGKPSHPPLALARDGKTVEAVFGAPLTTAVTRVRVEPRPVQGEARIWRPLGRAGAKTGPARMVADSVVPVQSFITGGRIVLYTPDSKFRFTVFEKGAWSPVRAIDVDHDLSSEQLIQELHRTVEEQAATEDGPETE
jgi:hypothetical protein